MDERDRERRKFTRFHFEGNAILRTINTGNLNLEFSKAVLQNAREKTDKQRAVVDLAVNELMGQRFSLFQTF